MQLEQKGMAPARDVGAIVYKPDSDMGNAVTLATWLGPPCGTLMLRVFGSAGA